MWRPEVPSGSRSRSISVDATDCALAVAAAMFIALSVQMNGAADWRLSLAIFTLAVVIAGIVFGQRWLKKPPSDP